jgi:hypothetical protein
MQLTPDECWDCPYPSRGVLLSVLFLWLALAVAEFLRTRGNVLVSVFGLSCTLILLAYSLVFVMALFRHGILWPGMSSTSPRQRELDLAACFALIASIALPLLQVYRRRPLRY